VLEVAHKGYCLYPDNFYTNPKLVDALCTRKTDAGTMRTNKKLFSDFLKRARLRKVGNSGSIPHETDHHEVERQK